MSLAVLECFAGISGDMLLGALLDAGVPESLLQDAARSLGIGAELRVHHVDRSGIRAIKVDVLEHGRIADQGPQEHALHEHDQHQHHGDHEHTHTHTHSHSHEPKHEHGEHHEHLSEHRHPHVHGRNWPEIRELIGRASIAPEAKRIALRAFELLAHAEAKVHGIAPEQVHFHEVGAVDTIIDIVCASAGAAALGVTEWRCSAVNTGSGFVNCAHGRFPVPAPATAALLHGLPVYADGPHMELTTPTGAAMLRALDCKFTAREPIIVSATGYGAGNRNPEGFANVLRLSLATPAATQPSDLSGHRPGDRVGDRVIVLECALDDVSPQVIAHTMELALENGALDVMAAPVTMKKGRLGTHLTLLCKPEHEQTLQHLLFRETTTIGMRRRDEERVILDREFVTVDTSFGKIRIKIASAAGQVLNSMPEYEDCRRAAREHDVPLRAVIEAALSAWTEKASA